MSSEHGSAEHIGDTSAIRDHDHDMVHDLSRRLDAVWRLDQYIVNARNAPHVQEFWKQVKEQELKNVERLKELIREHVLKNNF